MDIVVPRAAMKQIIYSVVVKIIINTLQWNTKNWSNNRKKRQAVKEGTEGINRKNYKIVNLSPNILIIR